MDITKPSITRLARRAGVKSVSDECFNIVRNLIATEIEEILRLAMIVNSEHQTKTLMPEDVYEALSFNGVNLAQSGDIGTSTCSK